MKINRISVPFILCMTAFLLSGCATGTDRQAQNTYKQTGIEAMESGNYEEAIAQFQSALDESLAVVGENEVDICYYKAMSYYLNGDTEEATNLYTALIEYDNKNATAYYLRGNLYLDLGEEEKAVADYDKSLEIDAQNLECYINIYDNLSETGYADQAKDYLERAVEINGNSAEDYAQRGRAYTLLGEYLQAEEELQKAVDAGSTEALLYKGQLLEEEGKPEEAQTMYENYISLHQDDANALNTLGCMEIKNQNYENALSYFTSALAAAEESGVSKKEILKNQILAYEYNGQFEEAKTAMASYSQLYTLDDELSREAVFLETR